MKAVLTVYILLIFLASPTTLEAAIRQSSATGADIPPRIVDSNLAFAQLPVPFFGTIFVQYKSFAEYHSLKEEARNEA